MAQPDGQPPLHGSTNDRYLMPTPDDLRASRDLAVGVLQGLSDTDWSASLTDLDIDVNQLCAHMIRTSFWYAFDLCATETDLAAVVPEVDATKPPPELVRALHVGAELLATVVAAAPAGARGFHPFGQADASGFAAMGCDEIIVHTHDIATGLGLDFEPPHDLAGRVLARLFPWAEGPEDPWTLLQWANGRIALPGRPQLAKWKWHCAPLAEWDGTAPVITN